MPDIIYRYDQLVERKKYESSDTRSKFYNSYHWGQRKLLINEIYFLTKYNDPTKIILYIGAADGYHIDFLAKMFPKNKFILYDPGTFKIKSSQQIEIHKQFFTDQEARKYVGRGNNILFISDIRNLNVVKNIKNKNEKEADDIIVEDLNKQRKWIEIIRPYRSILKFRTPYRPGTTHYFAGKIYLQQYGPLSSETRLLVKDPTKFTNYNNQEFDEKMYYFNINIRNKSYDIMKLVIDKLDIINNWDTTMELLILKKYLTIVTKNYSELNLIKLFTDITAYLTAYNKNYLRKLRKVHK
ncbi:MAG: polyA polymerase regulatory subunit [Faunusvirus sp.]|jgi:hypothetical protein|uniref:Cap-specific mRNA (nucleoside-2'-O-)-methyltransferase n=1 Tax=Faunusvirus sp. TaxID=2487766 RepID=A0A3G4ZXV2_9VIRU|nr:MAG: polyA polymerase regulatory subunit [Faunusvirus sp.]